jgi:hypothetical protein
MLAITLLNQLHPWNRQFDYHPFTVSYRFDNACHGNFRNLYGVMLINTQSP